LELRFLAKIYESMATSGRDLGRMEMQLMFGRKSVALLRQSLGDGAPFTARGSLSNSIAALATLQVLTGDLEGAVKSWEDALGILSMMAIEKPDHFTVQVNTANMHVLAARVLFDPDGPTLHRPDAAGPHFLEALAIGRHLLEVDPKETQAHVNHGIAAWRYGNALRATDAKGALALYEEAIAVLRPMRAKQFTRDATLADSLAASVLILNTLGRARETPPRIQEAKALCEQYREVSKLVFSSCLRLTARAEAQMALRAGRPGEAAEIYRRLFALLPQEEQEADQHRDLRSAYFWISDYRLSRDALRAAGAAGEADVFEAKARSIVDWWRKNNPAAARYLPQ
jgi:tetratricopeptide (TPR) repeat protein